METPFGRDAPSRAVSAAIISNVTSGDPSSPNIDKAFTGFHEPSIANEIISPDAFSMAGMDPSTKKYLNGTSDPIR